MNERAALWMAAALAVPPLALGGCGGGSGGGYGGGAPSSPSSSSAAAGSGHSATDAVPGQATGLGVASAWHVAGTADT